MLELIAEYNALLETLLEVNQLNVLKQYQHLSVKGE